MRRGVTATDVLIVVAMLGVLVSIGWSSFDEYRHLADGERRECRETCVTTDGLRPCDCAWVKR